MSENDDVRSYFDSQYLRYWDFPAGAADQVVIIERVERGQLAVPGTSKKKGAPVVYFANRQKGLVLNKTNLKAIGGMYGFKAGDWIGKPIAIYVGQTTFGDEVTPCIRVRPRIPQAPSGGRPAAPRNDSQQDDDASKGAAE